MENIFNRRLKYTFTPYLLTKNEYWNYLKVKWMHERSWAGRFLVLNMVTLIGIIIPAFAVGSKIFIVGTFLLLIASIINSCFYIFSSKTAIRWWRAFILVYLAATVFSLWLVSLNGAGIILLYFALSHLISLTKARSVV